MRINVNSPRLYWRIIEPLSVLTFQGARWWSRVALMLPFGHPQPTRPFMEEYSPSLSWLLSLLWTVCYFLWGKGTLGCISKQACSYPGLKRDRLR